MNCIIRCPACDTYTQHWRQHKWLFTEEEEGGHYYRCTVCHRKRKIGEEELSELLYQASRRYPRLEYVS